MMTGETHTVHCVRSEFWGWVPVLGSAHRDAEIGVPDLHWHVDPRFFSDELLERWLEASCTQDPSEALRYGVTHAEVLEQADRQMLVQRQMPTYPDKPYSWMPCLEAAYQNDRIDPERPVCPHRKNDR